MRLLAFVKSPIFGQNLRRAKRKKARPFRSPHRPHRPHCAMRAGGEIVSVCV